MKIKLILFIIFLFACGCKHGERYDPACRNESNSIFSQVEERVSEDGFSYKVVEIEGRKFIAFRTSYGHWEITGPID